MKEYISLVFHTTIAFYSLLRWNRLLMRLTLFTQLIHTFSKGLSGYSGVFGIRTTARNRGLMAVKVTAKAARLLADQYRAKAEGTTVAAKAIHREKTRMMLGAIVWRPLGMTSWWWRLALISLLRRKPRPTVKGRMNEGSARVRLGKARVPSRESSKNRTWNRRGKVAVRQFQFQFKKWRSQSWVPKMIEPSFGVNFVY